MKTVFEARIFHWIIFIGGFCYLLISYKFHGCLNRQDSSFSRDFQTT